LEQLLLELKGRFRKEYLAHLVGTPRRATESLKVGDLVLVETDNKKRRDWPLGRICDLYPGRDGVKRVAKIKTQDRELIRAIQRLYPLEGQVASFREKPRLVLLSQEQKILKNYCVPEWQVNPEDALEPVAEEQLVTSCTSCLIADRKGKRSLDFQPPSSAFEAEVKARFHCMK
jgi:hypothetical protein